MDVLETSDALVAARRERHGVRAALVALESAAASPVTDSTWSAAMADRLQALRRAFAHHIAVTESDEGLFAEMLDRAPRLAHRTHVLRDDHVAIMAAIDGALAATAAAATDEDASAGLRDAVTTVMGRVTRHRQLGADLVHEAYNVDIEGGE